MVRRGFPVLLLSWLILFAVCGKKGPIMPPLVRVPQAVEDFAVLQKGRKVRLQWTNPEAYVDGNLIAEVAAVEVWLVQQDRAARSAAEIWTGEEFGEAAELLVRISAGQFDHLRLPEEAQTGLTYIYSPKEEDFGRLVLTFALRVRDGRNRVSAFCGPVSLELLLPPLPPEKVAAEVFEDHIRIRWQDAVGARRDPVSTRPGGYNLYRSEEEVPAQQLNSALIKKLEYSDKSFSFGRTYRYFVRAVLESAPGVESEDSAPVEILARDTFPPAPPTGLSVIGGPGFIALSWEASREPDLGGYRVWRRIAGRGEFIPIARLTASASTFQDSEVETKRRYEYAITAFDTEGNESRTSEPAIGILRDSPPE